MSNAFIILVWVKLNLRFVSNYEVKPSEVEIFKQIESIIGGLLDYEYSGWKYNTLY